MDNMGMMENNHGANEMSGVTDLARDVKVDFSSQDGEVRVFLQVKYVSKFGITISTSSSRQPKDCYTEYHSNKIKSNKFRARFLVF